jgi:predicted ATPase
MIFEDAHWTDPTSLEAFGWVVDVIANLPLLLIVTFRPEFEAPWIGRPHVAALTLNRLKSATCITIAVLQALCQPLPLGLINFGDTVGFPI